MLEQCRCKRAADGRGRCSRKNARAGARQLQLPANVARPIACVRAGVCKYKWCGRPLQQRGACRQHGALADTDLMPRGIVHRPDCRRLVGVRELTHAHTHARTHTHVHTHARTHTCTHTHTRKQCGIISWKPGCACTARRLLRPASV